VVKVKHHDHDANNPNPAQNNPVGAKLTQKNPISAEAKLGEGTSLSSNHVTTISTKTKSPLSHRLNFSLVDV
jgi:hypothetical protein